MRVIGRILGWRGRDSYFLLLYSKSFAMVNCQGIKLSIFELGVWGYLGRWDDEKEHISRFPIHERVSSGGCKYWRNFIIS